MALDGDPDNVSNCLFFENTDGNYFSGENTEDEIDISSNNDNLIADPQFYECGQYMLSINSPCIDKGVTDTTGLNLPEYDIYGTMRILDGDGDGNAVIDIGACEFNESLLGTHEYISICQGEEYEGHTESGTFQKALTSSTGNDSIVTTHLTVNPTFVTEEYVSICEGEEYLGLTEAGSHARKFETIHGCDSTVTTNLSFYPSFKPAFTIDADTLTSNEIYFAYQWYDAGGAIAGATDRRLVIGNSGEYHLEGTNAHGCTYVSDVQYVIQTYAIVFPSGEFEFSVIPNPNRGVFLFRIDANPPENLSVKLVNGLGQVIETRIIPNPSVNQTEPFHVYHLSAGVYHLVVISDKHRNTRKIVIQ